MGRLANVRYGWKADVSSIGTLTAAMTFREGRKLGRVTNQPAGLIEVLLNQDAEFGDRDDAAIDLGAFDEIDAENALAQVACDETADENLADSCGESLAEIWCRKGRVTGDIIGRLTPVARRIATGTMEALCPALAASFREGSRASE